MNAARSIHHFAFETFLGRIGPRVLGFQSDDQVKKGAELAWTLADAALGAFTAAWGDAEAPGGELVGRAYVALVAGSVRFDDKAAAGRTLELGSRFVSVLADQYGVALPSSSQSRAADTAPADPVEEATRPLEEPQDDAGASSADVETSSSSAGSDGA